MPGKLPPFRNGVSRMSEHIVSINRSNAQQMLIEESYNRPVVVDFWADWCAPCKQLMPLLESLANEHQGAFLLAKINCDQEQMIASQFGVRSLPTVMVIRDGQPVDGFVGAQPESTIRALLDKHLPKPWDVLLNQARELMALADFGAAITPLKQAQELSRNRGDICCTLAEALIELNRLDDAKAIIEAVKMADQDAYYEQVKSMLALKAQASKAPEIAALEQKLNAEPDNLDLAYQLAVQFSQHNHHREALQLLLEILKQDRQFQEGAARKSMLDIFKSLGPKDPLVVEFQRQLFSLLY
jgi:putative thioredoxin